jgi:uncharacterized membrane protein
MKKKLKPILLTGIAVLVPMGLTIYIFFFLISIMDAILLIIPSNFHPDELIGFHIPGLGFIIIFILTLLIGLVTNSYLGKKFIDWGENIIDKIPVVRNIYKPTKQLVDSLVSNGMKNFNRVVMIEFPRKGVYTIAFVTGHAGGEVKGRIGSDYINVYVPTTPNPTSGYFLIVSEREVINLDMTVEEAFRMIISIGLVVPETECYKKVSIGAN